MNQIEGWIWNLNQGQSTLCIREACQKKNWIFYDIVSKGGKVENSKHDFFPKRNYDKRVDARIISQIIKTMNNSLFIEK